MGAIIPVALIIASALASAAAVVAAVEVVTVVSIIVAAVAVAATVASIIFYAEGDIKNSMLFAGIGISAGIAGLYLAASQQVTLSAAMIYEDASYGMLQATTAYQTATLSIVGYIDVLTAGFKTFLEAIQFRLIMSMHQIAYLISGEYRQAVSKIFGQIAEVAAAIGIGATFFHLALRDSRNLILSTSAMMGMKYDMADIAYMQSLKTYLTDFATNIHRYENDPAQMLWDMDQMITRPAIDAHGSTMQVVYSSVERLFEGVRAFGEDLTKVRGDLVRLIYDLPGAMTTQIRPWFDKAIESFDKFIKLTYDPAMKVISAGFAAVGAQIGAHETELRSTAARLARPGKYLSEVNNLPEDERKTDELIIGELASRSDREFLDAVTAENTALLLELENSATRALPSPVSIKSPVIKSEPTVDAPAPTKTRENSPFVGEY